MTIAPDLVARVLRLHTAERWRVGTIARQLHVHRDTVRRVLAEGGQAVPPSPLRPGRIDAYRPFILATLAKFPTLTAARLYAMVGERAIRFIRDSFFAGRTFSDLRDLNAQARAWVAGVAADRRWPEDSALSVRQAFGAEGRSLMALPETAPALGERVAVRVGKTPYVRFDLNDYSVPHTQVQRTLAVLADEQWVRVLDGATELACHRRCWDSHAQIEDDAHVQRLVDAKRAGRAHRACDRLAQAAPASAELLQRAGARGENLGSITATLMRLLERWGAGALQAAITEALARDVAKRDAPVRTHDLRSYDRHPDCQPDPPKEPR